ALIADEHDFIAFEYLQCPHQRTVTIRALNGDHALPAAPVYREIIDWGTLTVATLAGRQNVAVFLRNDKGYDILTFLQPDAPDATRHAAHRTYIVFVEPDCLAAA